MMYSNELDESYPGLLGDEDEETKESLSAEQQLELFREQWRSELQASRNTKTEDVRTEEPSIEDQARYLFLQGIDAERSHQLVEAIMYYRKAVQLVPDIEFKIDYSRPTVERKERTQSESSFELTGEPTEVGEEEEDLSNLLHHLHKLHIADGPLCVKEFNNRPGMSFSSLPAELMNFILKWLISSDLDIVSLENVAQVCRGFYVACRDEELWRLICQRIWGVKCGNATSYGGYRNMYYQRPRVRFNGCYISKTVYFRQGENNMSYFYRPFHMVEYYRYLRLYPDGLAVMVTTPDEPIEVVHKLNKSSKIQGLLYGRYRQLGDMNHALSVTEAIQHIFQVWCCGGVGPEKDVLMWNPWRMKYIGGKVSLILKRRKVDYNQTVYGRYRRKKQQKPEPDTEETFHVEFTLQNTGQRTCGKLTWQHYSRHSKIKGSDEEIITEFLQDNTCHNTHPALIFSRVKSYNSVSVKPLG